MRKTGFYSRMLRIFVALETGRGKIAELEALSREVRQYLVDTVTVCGGHFAGNLGVVELTVALHDVFSFPDDKIIWDVGHQSYAHKILTGRKDEIPRIRNFGGISGFPKREENDCDAFGTGHSSTAISAAMGMAQAFKLKKQQNKKVIAVVGDGALTGGMAFEALNNLGSSDLDVLVIINDNRMGIDPNTGAIDLHLSGIENAHPNIFENFSLPYSGPFDGHDLEILQRELRKAAAQKGPRVLHLRTVKGKGFEPAEKEQTKWHSTNRYVKISPGENKALKWQDVFADALIELAEKNEHVVGITPAMPSGSGMIKAMQKMPDRFFDVGIAEQHAVTFAAGLATEGIIPVLNIYSTFLQRGYDQLIHDVALQDLPVVFCIDRAGLVGEDGPTHHGSFDLSYLKCIPNLIVAAPSTEKQLRDLMYTATKKGRPFCVRYPKGNGFTKDFAAGEFELLEPGIRCERKGEEVAIIGTGMGTELGRRALSAGNFNASLYDNVYIKPLDEAGLERIFNTYSAILTLEDNALKGGMGEEIRAFAQKCGFGGKIISLGIPDAFVPHGDNELLYDWCGFGVENIRNALLKLRIEN